MVNLKIAGFIQEGRFDLNSYLTYLFKKVQDCSQADNKKMLERNQKNHDDD